MRGQGSDLHAANQVPVRIRRHSGERHPEFLDPGAARPTICNTTLLFILNIYYTLHINILCILKSNIISSSIQTSIIYVLKKSTNQSKHTCRYLVRNRWRSCWIASPLLVHSWCFNLLLGPYLPYPCGSLVLLDCSLPSILLMWYRVLARMCSWQVPSLQPR